MITAEQYRSQVAGRTFAHVTYRGQDVSNVTFIHGIYGDCVNDFVYAIKPDYPVASEDHMVSMDLRYLTLPAAAGSEPRS